tara:strand:+ start:2052 stop:2294 length:243 start_codon:yes stop_codon:yes gene_type:complete
VTTFVLLCVAAYAIVGYAVAIIAVAVDGDAVSMGGTVIFLILFWPFFVFWLVGLALRGSVNKQAEKLRQRFKDEKLRWNI